MNKNVLEIEASLYHSISDYERVENIMRLKNKGIKLKKEVHALRFKLIDVPIDVQKDVNKFKKLVIKIKRLVMKEMRKL